MFYRGCTLHVSIEPSLWGFEIYFKGEYLIVLRRFGEEFVTAACYLNCSHDEVKYIYSRQNIWREARILHLQRVNLKMTTTLEMCPGTVSRQVSASWTGRTFLPS